MTETTTIADTLRKYADDCDEARRWGVPTIYPQNPVTERFAREAADAFTSLATELAAERERAEKAERERDEARAWLDVFEWLSEMSADEVSRLKQVHAAEAMVEAHAASMSNTDGADTRTVLLAMLGCAMSWEGNARILGNVRAEDACRALRVALGAMAQPTTVNSREWRNDAFEKSASIVERYGADPQIARDIRALIRPVPAAAQVTTKPCPCGSSDIRRDHNLRNHQEEVFCDDCGATVSINGTAAEAIAAWNRFAALEVGDEPGRPVAVWKVPVRVTEGSTKRRQNVYTECLPFHPGEGVEQLGDPVALYESHADELRVIDPSEWTPCTPEWLDAHPGQCDVAPRVWSEERQNHYHPVNWPASPAQHEPTAWCQPMKNGEHTPRQFIVRFEDADRGDAVFDDEIEARAFWKRANDNWNCYLFGALPLQPSPSTSWLKSSAPGRCPFDGPDASGLDPAVPCPVCGDLGTWDNENMERESKCVSSGGQLLHGEAADTNLPVPVEDEQKREGTVIHWHGTEEQVHAERMKACRERRAEWGESCCEEKDGSCSECGFDMAVALQVPHAAAAMEGE